MMDKAHILVEIKRTAAENGGIALGRERFYAETGIRQKDWYGKHWIRWGDALQEAGFAPNALQSLYTDELLLGNPRESAGACPTPSASSYRT
jgi:hypothetical protein